MQDDDQAKHVGLAAELTIAWLGNQNNRVLTDEVPTFLQRMHEKLASLDTTSTPAAALAEDAASPAPAVSVRKSLVNRDHIVSLIDGKPYRTLRRHLTTHGLTPDEYRERYGLKPDYPMVAPAYSEARRAQAKRLGLGRKPAQQSEPEPAPVAKPPRRSGKAALAAGRAKLGTSQ